MPQNYALARRPSFNPFARPPSSSGAPKVGGALARVTSGMRSAITSPAVTRQIRTLEGALRESEEPARVLAKAMPQLGANAGIGVLNDLVGPLNLRVVKVQPGTLLTAATIAAAFLLPRGVPRRIATDTAVGGLHHTTADVSKRILPFVKFLFQGAQTSGVAGAPPVQGEETSA